MARTLEGITCDCGKPAEYMDAALFKKGRCSRCEVDDRQRHLDERNAQFFKVARLLLDNTDAGYEWSVLAERTAKAVDDLRADVSLARGALYIANKRREEAEKRVAMLEVERGPGLSAPKPIQTCDVGADWE